jgi:membrane associated rhomboid family serine protease
MNLAMLLTFRLIGFGVHGDAFLLNPAIQSEKLIAVWTEIEPLPLVVDRPAPIVVGILLFGVIHAYLYRWISPAWPTGTVKRALSLALLVFLLSFVFWEFFTPFNQFGEPLGLIAIELCFWAVIALADGFAIAAIMERGLPKKRRQTRGGARPDTPAYQA